MLSPRRPSHMLPPHAVVQAQMEALQHNDWPDGEDSGVRVAFAFTKPHDAEDFTPLVRLLAFYTAAKNNGTRKSSLLAQSSCFNLLLSVHCMNPEESCGPEPFTSARGQTSSACCPAVRAVPCAQLGSQGGVAGLAAVPADAACAAVLCAAGLCQLAGAVSSWAGLGGTGRAGKAG